MLFNSYVFIFLFLPVCLLVFFLIGRSGKKELAMGWLTVASLFFYAYWEPTYLLLLGLSIVVNFRLGELIAAKQGADQKRWLILGIVFNLGLLIYFKYTNFLVDSFNFVTGSDIHIEKIILPLAISFFTFQQIAYLVDASRGLTKEYNFLHYCLFVSFFPQLIAGPIVHHKEMLPQFEKQKTFSPSQQHLAIGLTIFVIGLFKKVILADGIAEYASPVFNASQAGQDVQILDAWAASIAYTFQIYFDFSGYSDMAIGLARMFGIVLPLNFDSPFKSKSIAEHWRRWHMTLSRFLRDYLYIPLGGNRVGYTKHLRNLFLTMFLGGIWHGAGITYVIWGAMHGVYLVINTLWTDFWKKHDSSWCPKPVKNFVSVCLTMVCLFVAFVFFRSESLACALNMLEAMFGLKGIPEGYVYMTDKSVLSWFLVAGIIIWGMPNTQQIMHKYQPALDAPEWNPPRALAWLEWRPSTGFAVAIGIMAAFSILSLNRVSEFLYFQF